MNKALTFSLQITVKTINAEKGTDISLRGMLLCASSNLSEMIYDRTKQTQLFVTTSLRESGLPDGLFSNQKYQFG
jgi:hypothetical protein